MTSGKWPVGARIPTEAELCEQFSVSRMTVNKAVRDLVNEGWLERTPRLGTFVCQRKAESPLMDIKNIADEIRSRGQTYHSEVIHLSRITAPEDVAMRLGIMLGSDVFKSDIVHYADETPIQVELRWVSPKHAPDYLEQDFSYVTPNQYLVETCPLSTIEHTVEAILPPPSIADLLQIDNAQPCLLLHRRTWSDNQLVSAALLYHPGNRYKLSATAHV
ncbi:GntR family transcriptional regulator, histidine utilization repressor [Enterovibrio nigricans DSM 22720]|uniref:Histidine utilization repressor n=2 Tax=Enterovibrio nigricans TaxID=504469 RepID=A0A1T4VNL3_9GAMM|nr:GntR family transcriptional regulator, histidine utilization repressor [Enterovibrio nigricans DSM 22720]